MPLIGTPRSHPGPTRLVSNTVLSSRQRVTACLVPQAQAEYGLHARIGDYTDFYTSIHHALNVGRLIFPDNPLTPTGT